MQNFLIKGRDNPVIINFSFDNGFSLAMFDRIEVKIGTETYATDTDPTKIVVDGNSLIISVGDTTELAAGPYSPEIIGYSTQYDDGYVLTSKKNPVLAQQLDIRS